jgi:hypothetical protein
MAQAGLADPLDENVTNREMYFYILAAQRELGANGQAPLAPVIPEGHNPPAASDAERAARENKIPDFQWGLTDDHEPDIRKSAKHFVVECKCLIKPRRSDWIYAEQYVIAGARRFVTIGYGYGMGARNGAMVGYVRALTFEELLREVEVHVAADGLAPLAQTHRHEDTYIELTHSLARPFPESPFELAHLWQRI